MNIEIITRCFNIKPMLKKKDRFYYVDIEDVKDSSIFESKLLKKAYIEEKIGDFVYSVGITDKLCLNLYDALKEMPEEMAKRANAFALDQVFVSENIAYVKATAYKCKEKNRKKLEYIKDAGHHLYLHITPVEKV